MIDKRQADIFDGLRGCAAITVAVGHTIQVFWMPQVGTEHWSAHLTAISNYAVGIFFLVSGFMITLSIFRHSAEGRFNWRSYALARFWRIYPPLFYSIVLTLAITAVLTTTGLNAGLVPGPSGYAARLASDVHFSVRELLGTFSLSYATLLPADAFLRLNGPLWTLSSEAWLYAIAGLSAFAISRRSGLSAAGGLVAITAIAIAQGFGFKMLDFATFSAIWTVGASMCIVNEIRGARPLLRLSIGMAFASITLLAATWVRYGNIEVVDVYASPHTRLAFVGIMGCVASAIGIALHVKRARCPLPLTRTAQFSYTLYLFHFPILVLGYALSPNLTMAALSLTAAIILSAASAPFIEWRPLRGRPSPRSTTVSV
jgi:peptidoglycan/LPS O-acetylase OafA/YrhL